jgi:hypothetical protein
MLAVRAVRASADPDSSRQARGGPNRHNVGVNNPRTIRTIVMWLAFIAGMVLIFSQGGAVRLYAGVGLCVIAVVMAGVAFVRRP